MKRVIENPSIPPPPFHIPHTTANIALAPP